jgi:hypothetical protein
MNIRAVRPNILWSSVVFFIMLAAYAYVYHYEPLSKPYSPYWNDKVIDVLTLIPAVAAAFLGVQVTRQFERSEPPFRIWVAFTLGWLWWVCGELSGFVYDVWYPGPYPEFTFIDVCWLMGYFFFGLSLYYQFRLIYFTGKGRQSALYLVYIGSGLLVTYGLTRLAVSAGLGGEKSWWAVYAAVLYPVFDFGEGVAAIWLSVLFGRGTFGRPWWGLIAFAFADGVNIFFWLGGDARVSERFGSLLDLSSNVVYVLGYMITALAFLAAYNVLQYGVGRRSVPLEQN